MLISNQINNTNIEPRYTRIYHCTGTRARHGANGDGTKVVEEVYESRTHSVRLPVLGGFHSEGVHKQQDHRP